MKTFAKYIYLSCILILLPLAHAENAPATGPEPAYEPKPDRKLVQIYQYKPMYFLMGHPNTKIEVSFRVELDRLIPLYLGYTQLMMWELLRKSPYFSDVDYNPEVFYRISLGGQDHWLDLGGFEHESNGKGGADERSWDRSYVRYHASFRMRAQTRLLWNVKAWVPYDYIRFNPDLLEHRGLWETEVTLIDFIAPSFEGAALKFRLYPGGRSFTHPLKGGQELTFRVKTITEASLLSYVAQIFHGYAENLRESRTSSWSFRAGIGF